MSQRVSGPLLSFEHQFRKHPPLVSGCDGEKHMVKLQVVFSTLNSVFACQSKF